MPLLLGLMSAVALVRLAAASAPATPATRAIIVEREAYLMGTVLRASVVASNREAGLAAIESALAEVRRMEDLLSTWRDDTELARLNAAPVARGVAISPELLSLLCEAAAWSRATGGAFDPAVGALVDAWDLRRAGRRPSRVELARAKDATGVAAFELDPVLGLARRTRAGSWIDSGGFGKGAALREARRALLGSGITSALLNFGGQLLAIGTPPDQAAWTVTVADPSNRNQPAALLRVRDGSVSTTAASERYVKVDGERLGHILDPRAGIPVPAWGSVTVVADDPFAADALSTALFVMGPDAGLRWARERKDVGVLILRETSEGLEASWNATLEATRPHVAPGVLVAPAAAHDPPSGAPVAAAPALASEATVAPGSAPAGH